MKKKLPQKLPQKAGFNLLQWKFERQCLMHGSHEATTEIAQRPREKEGLPPGGESNMKLFMWGCRAADQLGREKLYYLPNRFGLRYDSVLRL